MGYKTNISKLIFLSIVLLLIGVYFLCCTDVNNEKSIICKNYDNYGNYIMADNIKNSFVIVITAQRGSIISIQDNNDLCNVVYKQKGDVIANIDPSQKRGLRQKIKDTNPSKEFLFEENRLYLLSPSLEMSSYGLPHGAASAFSEVYGRLHNEVYDFSILLYMFYNITTNIEGEEYIEEFKRYENKYISIYEEYSMDIVQRRSIGEKQEP